MICSAADLRAQQAGSGSPLPGTLAGTERWIVCLRDRGFDLEQLLQTVRQAPAPARPALIAGLRQQAQADQAAIALAVAAAGGRVSKHFWLLSALAIEVPPGAVAALRQRARVASMFPVEGHANGDALSSKPADDETGNLLLAPPPPIANSVDAANHNVAAAWSTLGGYKGAGAVVAVFDSGIDADIDERNSTPDPHPSFLDAASQTRISAHLATDTEPKHANCNILTATSPYVSTTGQTSGYLANIGHAPECGHGTAMAAIIAGRNYVAGGLFPAFPADGHAPDAELVDVSMSSHSGSNATRPWIYSDEGYITAAELLLAHVLLGNTVHVANISLHGTPSPTHPVSLALDKLARQADILLVTCAGNTSDSSNSSNGFYHGVAVGAVHARTTAFPTNLAFVPLPQGLRGPLDGSPDRFYPDLCATGGGIGHDESGVRQFDYPWTSYFVSGCMSMPGLDLGNPSAYSWPTPNRVTPIRPNLGTSEACAQVAGAAALYRGFRPTSSAEEARAALLLNVLGTYPNSDGTTSDPAQQHTYSGRNTLGVGYVRDDLLAEFAARASTIVPLESVVSLNQAFPSADTAYGSSSVPLGSGRYAVVACWRRYWDPNDDTSGEGSLPNVDLRVLDADPPYSLLATSDSLANSYERAVFVAPSSGKVTIRVYSNGPSGLLDPPLPVQIVARKLATDLDPLTAAEPVYAVAGKVEAVSAGSGCTAIDQDWSVARIVPYASAYGSSAFFQNPSGSSTTHSGYDKGFDFGKGRLSTQPGPYQYKLHLQYEDAVMGGDIDIVGLRFRTWRPMSAIDLPLRITMAMGPPVNSTMPLPTDPNYITTMQVVVGGAGFRTVAAPASFGGQSSAATGREEFGVIVPFDSPQQPFSYLQGNALHLWIDVGASAPKFVVDGTSDYYPPLPQPGEPVEAHYWRAGSTETLYGQVPVLGLIAASPNTSRELRLEAIGEPWSGLTQTQFDVRVLSGVPTSLVLLFTGLWDTSPAPQTPCQPWLLNPGYVVGTTDSFGMAQFAVPVNPNVVGLDFGLQAGVFPTTGGALATNALRIRVGGGL
ncbi:MAG: S8 family serine peptidase [Planctomycetes bacterium]|nr:S8 family serine peptidase [Planctomycetota bacterium]